MLRLALLLFALTACDDDLAGDDAAYALPSDELPPPPTILQTGSCPGPVTFNLAAMTPGGSYRVGRSPNLGPGTPITSGPCAGTALRIGPPTTLVATGTASGGGTATWSFVAPLATCGQYLQVLDMSSCQSSQFHQIF